MNLEPFTIKIEPEPAYILEMKDRLCKRIGRFHGRIIIQAYQEANGMATTTAEPREIGMMYKDELVLKILKDLKTQTRRPVKKRKGQEIDNGALWSAADPFSMVWPYGNVGDRIWVRETFSPDHRDFYPNFPYVYRADSHIEIEKGKGTWSPEGKKYHPFHWRPSIHMPRVAARLILEITAIRIERLQQITNADCVAEGFEPTMRADSMTCKERFIESWDKIYSRELKGWKDNPDVWAITFKRIRF